MAAATIGATVFFQVETLAVTGNQRYTQEEIIAASGVELGDNLFWINKYQIEESIRQQLPYIGTIEIHRGLPSTLTFAVEEWEAVARVEVYSDPTPQLQEEGNTEEDTAEEAETETAVRSDVPWLISRTGRLLEQAGAQSGGISVTGLTILSPQAGTDMAVPQSQTDRLAHLVELLGVLQEEGMMDQVSAVDLTHATWMELRYRENFLVKLPLQEDMTRLVRLMAAAVDDTIHTRGEQVTGTMDLTQSNFDAIFHADSE